MKNTKIILCLFSVTLLAYSCNNPERLFKKAKAENTITEYAKFMKKYPDSPLARECDKFIDEIGPHVVVSMIGAGGILGDAMNSQAYNFIFHYLHREGRKVTFVDSNDLRKISDKIPEEYIWLFVLSGFQGSFQTELEGYLFFSTPGSITSWSDKTVYLTGPKISRDEFFNSSNPFRVHERDVTFSFSDLDDELEVLLDKITIMDVEEIKEMDPLK